MNDQMQCMEVWGGNRGVDQHFHMPGMDVWIYSRPHDNAANGGDVYYLSSCASGRISRLLLADVSGHGPLVSPLALRLRDLMRRHINSINQASFVAAMNDEFVRFNQEDRFATAMVGTFFVSTGSFQLCLAGHPPPLRFRQQTGTWDVFEAKRDSTRAPNFPLGVMEDVAYGETSVVIEPGDMILAYTDGLTESRVANKQLLKTQGLLELVRALNSTRPDELLPSLLAALSAQATVPLGDDLTVLLARADGSSVSLRNNLLAPFRILAGSRDATRFRETIDDPPMNNEGK